MVESAERLKGPEDQNISCEVKKTRKDKVEWVDLGRV